MTRRRLPTILAVTCLQLTMSCAQDPVSPGYPLAGTGQRGCFDDRREIQCGSNDAFDGQDAQNGAPSLSYRDNGDGTITDLVTGLMWTSEALPPRSFEEARSQAGSYRAGGYSDWRLPTVQELYSLMDFSGHFGTSAETSRPFIDTSVFEFSYGGAGSDVGSRFIDVQVWTSSVYSRRTGPSDDQTVFGVNFADGRIKGYPLHEPGSSGASLHVMHVRYVRGAKGQERDFSSSGVGTVTDPSTGLEWQEADDGVGRTWEEALSYCRSLTLGGHDDWFLPDAKQLYSIVDVSRVPAIDPIFILVRNDAYVWTSTTLLDGPDDVAPSKAAYVAFGPALGWFETPPGSGMWKLLDIHGAGAQRADPKSGDAAAFPHGFGPQGDDVRIRNQVRCVRRR